MKSIRRDVIVHTCQSLLRLLYPLVKVIRLLTLDKVASSLTSPMLAWDGKVNGLCQQLHSLMSDYRQSNATFNPSMIYDAFYAERLRHLAWKMSRLQSDDRISIE